MTTSEHVNSIRICRDIDCPECGFPETYAEADLGRPTPGADAIGCNRCGWRIEAVTNGEGE